MPENLRRGVVAVQREIGDASRSVSWDYLRSRRDHNRRKQDGRAIPIASTRSTALPVTNYSSAITVVPAEGGKSTVEWRSAFFRGYPNNDPPPQLNDEAALKAVGSVYRAGLDNLKKKAEAAR